MVVWSFGWKIGSKRLEGQRSPRVLFPISLVNIKIHEMLLRPSLSLMTKVGIYYEFQIDVLVTIY